MILPHLSGFSVNVCITQKSVLKAVGQACGVQRNVLMEIETSFGKFQRIFENPWCDWKWNWKVLFLSYKLELHTPEQISMSSLLSCLYFNDNTVWFHEAVLCSNCFIPFWKKIFVREFLLLSGRIRKICDITCLQGISENTIIRYKIL